jgi:hypothetical protein
MNKRWVCIQSEFLPLKLQKINNPSARGDNEFTQSSTRSGGNYVPSNQRFNTITT